MGVPDADRYFHFRLPVMASAEVLKLIDPKDLTPVASRDLEVSFPAANLKDWGRHEW